MLDELGIKKKPPSALALFLKGTEEFYLPIDPLMVKENVTTIGHFLTCQQVGVSEFNLIAWGKETMVRGMACFLGINIRIACDTNTAADPCLIFLSGVEMSTETPQQLLLANYNNVRFQSFSLPISHEVNNKSVIVSDDVIGEDCNETERNACDDSVLLDMLHKEGTYFMENSSRSKKVSQYHFWVFYH